MKLLVDTNIFLEVLLEQSRAGEARELLGIGVHDFLVSDFSLHSIGVLLLKRNKADAFLKFVSDIVIRAGTAVARLNASDMAALVGHAASFSLDFDDAYQYALADKYDLTIVSFDRDRQNGTRKKRAIRDT